MTRSLSENQLIPVIIGIMLALNVLLNYIVAKRFPSKGRARRSYRKA